ncbi:hypothetical protein Hanom_Chr16g01501441 [Helianthus anomalus]
MLNYVLLNLAFRYKMQGLKEHNSACFPFASRHIYPKISIEPGVENIYTQKFLYENYIYNTTGRKVRGVGRPSRPLQSIAPDHRKQALRLATQKQELYLL